MSKLIFIDRDGVINVDPIGDYIKRWEDFQFEVNALEALKLLSERGYQIIVISNQAGVGDGLYPESELVRIDSEMARVFKANGIHYLASFYCLHGKKAGCSCRKPMPGLFHRAQSELGVNPQGFYFIGDKISDVQAGHAAGLKTILVRTGHGASEEKLLPSSSIKPDRVFNSLWEAAVFITQ